jgi:hypothetical protein
MKVVPQYLEGIDVGERLRNVDESKVKQLAESMSAIGLLNPIHVMYSDDASVCTLVTGAHRLAAAKLLGWESIDTVEFESGSLEAQLAEIDENLMRSELTPAQRTSHVARRKQKWEALHQAPAPVPAWERDDGCSVSNGETEAGANSGRNPPTISEEVRGRGRPKGFAAATAEVTGESKRRINEQVAIAEALGEDLQKVEGTSLDKGVELQALAKLPEEQRHELVERAAAGEAVSARAVAAPQQPVKREIPALVDAINRFVSEAESIFGCGRYDILQAIRDAQPSVRDVQGLNAAMQPFGDVIDAIGEYLCEMNDVLLLEASA